MNEDLMPGKQLIDVELPDHNGHTRRLSELAAGDPLVVNFYRGWWCPKEQAFFRRLVALQDEVVHVVSGSAHPCRLQRLLVLGATHERAATYRSTGDHPRDPTGLGGTVMTGWCWFALVEADLCRSLTDAALAIAPAMGPDGHRRGTFAAWPAGRKPVPDALRMDARLTDRRAPAAMRQVLRGIPPTAVSTLVRDATTLAGAVTVSRADDPESLRDDPFSRLYPGRVLRAAPRMFATLPVPPGPPSSATSVSPGRRPASTTDGWS
jgi:AhpC/TSA family